MEKGLNARIKEQFGIGDADWRTYSPLVLAYLGDVVFDLIIRTIVAERGGAKVNALHLRTSNIVKAGTQAKLAEAVWPHLTEEEQTVYRRGRNQNSATMAKHATVADYRKATGFEALLGYLYLADDWDRIFFLVKKGLEELGEE